MRLQALSENGIPALYTRLVSPRAHNDDCHMSRLSGRPVTKVSLYGPEKKAYPRRISGR